MAQARRLSLRFDPWARWTAFLGFVGLMAVALVTVADVLMRWLWSKPIPGVDDLSQLAFAVVVVSCFPAGLLQGHNITIRFLGQACGARARHWLEALGAALTFVFFGLIAWEMVILTVEHRASHDTTMTVEAVTWPWWTVATAILVFCVPVQAAVVVGHFARAATGDEPGGTVEMGGEAEALGRTDGTAGGAV